MATVKGRVLLGWMPRDRAIALLMNDCVFDPPLSVAAAEALWEEYRDRAAALPERPPAQNRHLPMTGEEKSHAADFKSFIKSRDPKEVVEVCRHTLG